MKKITIIGDSYGCGEWMSKSAPYANRNQFYFRDIIAGAAQDYVETHPGLEYFLGVDGHACLNISSGGSSNIHNLKKLSSSLMIDHPRHEECRFLNPDYIIWFFTEPLRDLSMYTDGKRHHNLNEELPVIRERLDKCNYNLNKLNDELIRMSFEMAQKIYDNVGVPFILVESLGNTKKYEEDYTFCKHKIDNWVGKMVNYEVPTLVSSRIFEVMNKEYLDRFDHNEIMVMLGEAGKFHDILRGREDFPDGGHPNRDQHHKLYEVVKNLIQ